MPWLEQQKMGKKSNGWTANKYGKTHHASLLWREWWFSCFHFQSNPATHFSSRKTTNE